MRHDPDQTSWLLRSVAVLRDGGCDEVVVVLCRGPSGIPLRRHGHRPLLERYWELCADVTPYDATYVALAETLGATLFTGDARLARAPGPRCPIEVLPAVSR